MPSALLDALRVVPAVPSAVAAVAPAPVAPAPVAPAPLRTPAPAVPAGRRRLPAAVVAAATLAVLESLGLLALGLTSLDGIFGTGVRPSGLLVATTLLLLAGWVVLCAGGGANLVDGAGRTLMVAVSVGEIVLLVVLAGIGLVGGDGVWLVALSPLGALPVPALALLGLGVPTGKLLLASAPSALAWLEVGGRPRAARTAPVIDHRGLRGVTLTCIGLALTGVALFGGPADTGTTPSPAAVVDAP